MRRLSLIGTFGLLCLLFPTSQPALATQQTFYFDPGQGYITYTVTTSGGMCGVYPNLGT